MDNENKHPQPSPTERKEGKMLPIRELLNCPDLTPSPTEQEGEREDMTDQECIEMLKDANASLQSQLSSKDKEIEALITRVESWEGEARRLDKEVSAKENAERFNGALINQLKDQLKAKDTEAQEYRKALEIAEDQIKEAMHFAVPGPSYNVLKVAKNNVANALKSPQPPKQQDNG